MRTITTAALLVLAGCSQEQPEGARLTVTIVGEPGALAATVAAEATNRSLIAQGTGGELLPGLASSWRFVDEGRTLILRLKPNQWSDKQPLEAKQVVASLRRAAGGGQPALLASGIRNAEAIAARRLPASRLGALAPIARVVELRLDAASPHLLGWLADPGLAVTRTGKAAPTLAAYDAGGSPERRQLKRRTMAAAADARPADIIVATFPGPGPAIAAFTAGKTDIVIGDGLAGLGEARVVSPRDALRLDPLWGVYGYRVNTSRGPLADAGTRRALNLAVDRQALAAGFGLAVIEPATGLVPAGLGLKLLAGSGFAGPGFAGPGLAGPGLARTGFAGLGLPAGSSAANRLARITGGAAVAPDTRLPPSTAATLAPAARAAESRRLLAAAGWTAERPLTLLLLVPEGRDHIRVAEAVAAGWATAGARITIKSLPAAAFAAQIKAGDFDLAVDETSVPVPDAAALLARYRCGAGMGCNARADALLAEARTAGTASRAVLLARAEAELMAAPPLIPLFTPVRWALVSRQVDGWVPNRAGRHPLGRLAVR